uniref:Uncharacterized protein n=1 Tax=Arundo donax TaxID=35708 RepID=A0A0A9HFT2_ARUDO
MMQGTMSKNFVVLMIHVAVMLIILKEFKGLIVCPLWEIYRMIECL